MISNYYLIAAATRQIAVECSGAFFQRAFSLQSDELRIELSNEAIIVAIMKPAHCALYLDKRNSSTPKRNLQYFFEQVEGHSLNEVTIETDDKLIHLQFGDFTLDLRFFNSPNALLRKGDEVISTFKKEVSREAPIRKDKALLALQDYVKERLPMLGKYLEEEFFARYDLAKDTTEFEKNLINVKCKEYDVLLKSFRTSYTYIISGKEVLSPIELYHLSQKPEKTFTDISEGIFHILRTRDQKDRLLQSKESVRTNLLRAITNTDKHIEEISKSLTNMSRAERHSATGTALLSEAHNIPIGAEEIELEVLGEIRSIPLDSSKSIYQNAEFYFEKARSSKNVKKELEERLPSIERKKITLASFMTRLDVLSSPSDIDALKKEMVSRGMNIFADSEERAELDPLSKFKRFILPGGYFVLVGKNAKQNDDLTLHVAKKEDIWFHARHVPGSHVILQTAKHKDIPNEIIEMTAAIAAYFSDAKSQKHAPVAYTRRKYVRKPRGAAPGAVHIEKEEVVIVTPQIPENNE